MLAITLETAKNAAVGAAIVLLALAVVSAWLIKTVVTKVVLAVLLAGLAYGVWTQRGNLQTCADKAKAEFLATGDNAVLTCTFFGSDVKIPTG